jgi:hypothetical protein
VPPESLREALPFADKNLDRWIGGYAEHLLRRQLARLRPEPSGTRHLIFALCDHYEPLWRGAQEQQGEARVRTWRRRYPLLAADVRDADGFPPRHSFFFPGEQYRPRLLELLEPLCRAGFGEVELHLHHDRDDEDTLRAALVGHVAELAKHGHLSRAPDGRPRYGFIHGNWALANARPDGRWCGVDAELPLLFATGCYADFTFPAAPDPSQPNVVNRIYWPTGDLGARRAHENAEPARVGEVRRDRILLVQGPLAIARRYPRWSPRLEYSALTANDPATPARVATWLSQHIHVEGRPDWVFVKAHTHGAPEAQADSLLGRGGRSLHQALAAYNDGRRWKLHYVTAREMYNIAMAAMSGKQGNPGDYRDFLLPPPPVAR